MPIFPSPACPNFNEAKKEFRCNVHLQMSFLILCVTTYLQAHADRLGVSLSMEHHAVSTFQQWQLDLGSLHRAEFDEEAFCNVSNIYPEMH